MSLEAAASAELVVLAFEQMMQRQVCAADPVLRDRPDARAR
jgi:hypothetical protein